MIAFLALAIGLVAGLAARGSIKGLGELHLQGEVVLLVMYLVQGIARGRLVGTTATSWGGAVWFVSSAVLASLLVINTRHPGAVVAAAGTILNMLVVIANGGMPVELLSAGQVGASSVASASRGFYAAAQPWTIAAWAGDVVPLSVLGQTYLLSVGDILLGVGVAVVVASAMTASAAVVQTLG